MKKMINPMIKPYNTVIWVASILCIVLGQDKNYNNFQEGLSLERSGKIEKAIIIYKEILNNSKIDLFFLQGTVVSTEHLGYQGEEILNIKANVR